MLKEAVQRYLQGDDSAFAVVDRLLEGLAVVLLPRKTEGAGEAGQCQEKGDFITRYRLEVKRGPECETCHKSMPLVTVVVGLYLLDDYRSSLESGDFCLCHVK